MAKSNIIEQTGLYTVTSGIGDLSFSGAELAVLYDGDFYTSPSGLSVTNSDTLVIESDFSSRVYLDSIRVYLQSATASGTVASNLDIEYRNASGDVYTTSGTGVGPDYYYADNTPAFFAPRQIRITMANTDCTLLEIVAYNNDDIVDFGTNGTVTEMYIEAYDGNTAATAVPIYNDRDLGTGPVTAYVCLDYINSDPLLKLSATQHGTYYGIADSVLLSSNAISTESNTWDQGVYANTQVQDTNVVASYKSIDVAALHANLAWAVTSSGVWVGRPGGGVGWINARGSTDFNLWTRNDYIKAWYYEVTVIDQGTSTLYIGIARDDFSTTGSPGASSLGYSYYGNNGYSYNAGVGSPYGETYTTGDVIGVAFYSNGIFGSIFYSKNGVWQNNGDPVAKINPATDNIPQATEAGDPCVWNPCQSGYSYNTRWLYNYGQIPFKYTIPEGYSPLYDQCTGSGIVDRYITPVFDMEDKYAQSYFKIDDYTVSGTYFSYEEEADQPPSIRIQSSDTAPVVLEEIFFIKYYNYYKAVYGPDHSGCRGYITSYNTYTGVWTPERLFWDDNYPNDWPLHSSIYTGSRFNPRKQTALMSWTTHPSSNYIRGITWDYPYVGNHDISFTGDSTSFSYQIVDYDGEDGWWGYSHELATGSRGYDTLDHWDYEVSISLAAINLAAGESIGQLSAEKVGGGVWYTDPNYNTLYHRDSAGNILKTITTHEQPRAVTSTFDDGCWVIDNFTLKAYRYDNDGNIVQTVSNMNSGAVWMENDYSDGFWYVTPTTLNHVQFDGTKAVNRIEVSAASRVLVGLETIIVYSKDEQTAKLFNKSGVLFHTEDKSPRSYLLPPIIASASYDTLRANPVRKYRDYPAAYDPVWGVSGTVDTTTIPLNSFVTPKTRYHRLAFAFKTPDIISSAELRRVISPVTVKVPDIFPKESRNVYIKPEFQQGALRANQEITLKTWWYIEE